MAKSQILQPFPLVIRKIVELLVRPTHYTEHSLPDSRYLESGRL